MLVKGATERWGINIHFIDLIWRYDLTPTRKGHMCVFAKLNINGNAKCLYIIYAVYIWAISQLHSQRAGFVMQIVGNVFRDGLKANLNNRRNYFI